MLNAGVLTFKEFAMREPLPLATIHEAVLEFLRRRDDVVVFGATAVNAYASEPRMTQDIDLMSTRARRNWPKNCANISVNVSTLRCACRMFAEAKDTGCFRCKKKAIVIWLMCDRLSPCHSHKRLKKFGC